MSRRLKPEERLEIRAEYARGVPATKIASRIGCSLRHVFTIVAERPGPPRRRSSRQLTLAEREEIAIGLHSNESMRSIARRIKVTPSTVSREVERQEQKPYRASSADRRADTQAGRPQLRKLHTNKGLAQVVQEKLREEWSPEQISQHLRISFPDTPQMQVSAETIYKTLYVQGRGHFRKKLSEHLRTGRAKRKPQGHHEKRGRIRDMVNISERPAEVEDRAVPGHWEGDLIMGKNNRSAIGTLVERTTRFVMLLHLPNGPTALEVRNALTKKIQKLPEQLQRSLTWDQGYELSQHAQFTIDTNIQVYFCDPHSPWQRGSNENTNGLLRQYFPKGTDLSVHSEAKLDEVTRKLNTRPRQTLGWKTPSASMSELLR